MNEVQLKKYAALQNNEAVFNDFRQSLDPEKELLIGWCNPETGETGTKTVKVKDASNDDLSVFYNSFCAKKAQE